MKLSIIIPALRFNKQIENQIQHIYAVLSNEFSYEIIIPFPNNYTLNKLKKFKYVHYINQKGNGIYDAMNSAIALSKSDYLYFIGDDDMIVTNFLDVFLSGCSKQADLILGNVFFGNSVIYKNNPSKFSLFFKNWCHQGVIYKSTFFTKYLRKYPLKYKFLSDYYGNMVLINKRPKIFNTNVCIAWYSNRGVSSKNIDQSFKKDLAKNIKTYFGIIYFILFLFKRMLRSVLSKEVADTIRFRF